MKVTEVALCLLISLFLFSLLVLTTAYGREKGFVKALETKHGALVMLHVPLCSEGEAAIAGCTLRITGTSAWEEDYAERCWRLRAERGIRLEVRLRPRIEGSAYGESVAEGVVETTIPMRVGTAKRLVFSRALLCEGKTITLLVIGRAADIKRHPGLEEALKEVLSSASLSAMK